MLAPARTTDTARTAAESVCKAVAELFVTIHSPVDPVRIDGVTVSIGTAHNRRRTTRQNLEVVLTALLWAADRALYEAKYAGGNAVCFCRPT